MAFLTHSSSLFPQEIAVRVHEARLNIHIQFVLIFLKYLNSNPCAFGVHCYSCKLRLRKNLVVSHLCLPSAHGVGGIGLH